GVFTASSIAAGLAPAATWLIVARFVQGVGSGLLNPQGLGMIQQYFRGSERGRAFGSLGTAVGVSVAIGPVLGGLVIELGGPQLGWRLTFLVNVPIGIMAMILGWLWSPRPLRQRGGQPAAGQQHKANRGLRSLDPMGGMLLGLAVLRDSTKGNRIESTARPSSSPPMGSSERSPRLALCCCPAAGCPPRWSSGLGNHSQPRIMAMMPMGTLTRKVSRQPSCGPPSSITSPPSTGPMATDTPTAVPR